MTHFMPDPDELDECAFVSDETLYRSIFTQLKNLYETTGKPTTITYAVHKLSLQEYHKDLLIQALRVLVRDGTLTQIDRYTFVASRYLPPQTVDSEYPTYYQYTTEEPVVNNDLPTRKQVIDSVAEMISSDFGDRLFRMDEIAKLWAMNQDRKVVTNMSKIFNIKSGVAIFMYIIDCLVKRRFIEYATEKNGFGLDEGYRKIQKKSEPDKVRSLDDDWLS